MDGSEDQGTLRVIRDRGVIQLQSPRGRGIQMNAGAAAARGDILLFLHADTILPVRAFPEIVSAMGSERFDSGAFALSFDKRRLPFRLIALGANIRTCMTRIPYGDQAIFLPRDFFMDLGMYRNIPLLEDVDLMKRVRRDGKKVFLSPLKIVTSVRRWERDGIVKRTVLNLLIRALFMAGMKPERLRSLYYGARRKVT